ncbi:Glycosyltransferase involved in cell wall bisynthesis [Flavobacterium succinicans]|uniref:Glycosyltransferase involved in cell wall bisynthesis n=1 Tax=Flavobacterium succinicans TaxID=29536 RepID=A0A1I4ZBB8_9FLAO|nr:glycosyltransferase [Flavobacterium succinicans]SFN47555.1 Glycosyltransferase involved in cell wall bisynthesis [Flavobacterium succinicans]
MKKLLVIGFVWPEPNSSAAGSRMMQLIGLFQKQGYEVTFASAAQDSDFMIDLSEFGIDKVAIKLNDSSFDEFVGSLQPTVVLFDRFMIEEQFGWRVIENCPNAIRILDTEDLHCLRLARQKAFKQNRPFSLEDLLVEEVAKREVASILRCDLTLMVSEFEMDVLQIVFKIDASLLFYLPILSDAFEASFVNELPSFEERDGFVFIGNFLHEPNWNAVQYLKETIWPKILQKLPNATLKIYGAYPSQKVLQLHHPKMNFFIMGRAEDAQKVVQQSKVVLAPLRFGAGIKGKLLEAMQTGTPSVTTSIGAESMQGDLPWNGFVNDAVEDFVDAAVQLYTDKSSWLTSQQNGFAILNQRYQKGLFESIFVERLQYLFSTIEEHRLNNFYGALLQHHTLASTKYMSKWIEAKNK